MKRRWIMAVLLISIAVIFAGCKKSEGDTNYHDEVAEEATADEKGETEESTESKENEASQESEEGTSAEEETASNEEENAETSEGLPAGMRSEVKKGTLLKNAVCSPDDFKNRVVYASRTGLKTESIDYSKSAYTPGRYEKDMKASDAWKKVEEKTAGDELRSMRMVRTDRQGSTIDFTVYTDPSTRMIDKITSCEFCATGREMTQYYFDQGELIYAYRYETDIYGSTYEDGKLPGKKCSFADNVMVFCELNDKDVDYVSTSYARADYDKMDSFHQAQYDQLEEEMIGRAYLTYEKVANIPSTAVISGYVGDEFGGVLSNVKMTLTSKANEYSQEMTTNGDGYFEARVPVNTDDWYGIVCKYGDYPESTVDDIFIRKGTTTYSLGVIYMREDGLEGHDRNTYLLNANYAPPVKVGKGEYCVALTFDASKADLKPFAMDLKNGKSATDLVSVIKADKDDVSRYYVTDQRGGHSGNPMTYEMSTSQATVRVYDESKLVASFQVPVNHAGVVWEVFSVQNGMIVPSGNFYYEGGTAVFFE